MLSTIIRGVVEEEIVLKRLSGDIIAEQALVKQTMFKMTEDEISQEITRRLQAKGVSTPKLVDNEKSPVSYFFCVPISWFQNTPDPDLILRFTSLKNYEELQELISKTIGKFPEKTLSSDSFTEGFSLIPNAPPSTPANSYSSFPVTTQKFIFPSLPMSESISAESVSSKSQNSIQSSSSYLLNFPPAPPSSFSQFPTCVNPTGPHVGLEEKLLASVSIQYGMIQSNQVKKVLKDKMKK